jgi:hypothetical protein
MIILLYSNPAETPAKLNVGIIPEKTYKVKVVDSYPLVKDRKVPHGILSP